MFWHGAIDSFEDYLFGFQFYSLFAISHLTVINEINIITHKFNE